jgi:hypothetical protein
LNEETEFLAGVRQIPNGMDSAVRLTGKPQRTQAREPSGEEAPRAFR